ncbi:hypothetical protein SCLCIDRAFT_33795 [Scleroderma citrinum Foug A]|uniref:Uncharacterized protein n=1 Tax=Scleroderma citrinum Foug A TaxID=1036808 RepID=A0A0C3D3R4_9AGAM|nr:hypothetical protein SCLCIDRAFT_33795 [Scleroderma citrinum Foug A]
MPNISVATFRGVLWWLCGPDVFWIRSLFFHIDTWVQQPYRHVSSHFGVAALCCFKLEPSASMSMPNESVQTQCFLHSIRVNVAAARCAVAVYAIVASVSTAITIASSLSRLALNIWRNRLPSLSSHPNSNVRPSASTGTFQGLAIAILSAFPYLFRCSDYLHVQPTPPHGLSIHPFGIQDDRRRPHTNACLQCELPQLVQSISALDLCTQPAQPLACLMFHAACLAC